jgi:hypothetical protein
LAVQEESQKLFQKIPQPTMHSLNSLPLCHLRAVKLKPRLKLSGYEKVCHLNGKKARAYLLYAYDFVVNEINLIIQSDL